MMPRQTSLPPRPATPVVPVRTLGRRRLLQTGSVLGGAALGILPTHRAKAAQTEIRFLNIQSDPQAIAFFKKIAAEYEGKTGVKVTMETIVGTSLWTKVTTAIKTGRPYDIITFAQPTQTILLAQEGQLVPMTDIINEVGIKDFYPYSLMPYKNDQWWLPYNLDICGLYYRKDWLDEQKLSVPTTWAEFQQVAKAFTDPSRRRFGTALPYSAGITPWNNTGFLWASGVKFYDDDWNVLVDTPEIKPRLARALEFLAEINPYNAPGQFNATLLSISTNFVSGTAGIAASAGRLAQEIEDKSPDLADKFVLAPYPAPDGGKGAVTFGDQGFGIGKSPNSNAALDFMMWFMKAGKMVDFQVNMPLYNQIPQYSTYDDPRWRDNPTIRKYWSTMQTVRDFLDPTKVSMASVQTQGSRMSVNQGLVVNSEVIVHMYQNVLTKAMTVDAAIDDCAAQMRKFTKKDA